jgi:heat shock protein HtpX
MKRRSFGRDRGLSLRMLFTGSLLGLLYVVFGVALFYFLNVGLAPLLVIVVGLAVFQYYTSDKLALAASGAKIVSAEEAPELHAMVDRSARWPASPSRAWRSSTPTSRTPSPPAGIPSTRRSP